LLNLDLAITGNEQTFYIQSAV